MIFKFIKNYHVKIRVLSKVRLKPLENAYITNKNISFFTYIHKLIIFFNILNDPSL